MKQILARSFARTAAALSLLLWLTLISLARLEAAPLPAYDADDVREDINKTVALNPGSQVSLRGINGNVTIETWNSGQAEIRIAITASSREALARRPLLVENTADSLTIRTENNHDWDGDHGRVRHQVHLRLPTSVNLKVSSVNGTVEVSEITGSVAISSVNGRVNIAQAGSATEISSVNGRVTLALASLDSRGLRVSSINGGVELRIPANTNAELEVRSVNGSIDTDFPITITGTQRRGELRGTLGSGGSRLTITSVNGGVHLKSALK